MARTVRIEVKGKDDFWERAFLVEWEYQFPQKRLIRAEGGFLVEFDWMADLCQVGEQCLCRIVEAPANPMRRRWMTRLFSAGER